MESFVRARVRLVGKMGALLLLALGSPSLQAQEPVSAPQDSLLELRRGGGETEIGRVVGERGDTLVFETLSGERFEVRRAYVRLRPARGRVVEGEFWREDKNSTRLFFAPTGRTLRQGEGYAGLFLILPFVGYGVTDDITLAGGVPFVGSLAETPVWIAPKVRVYHTPRAQVSTGVFAVHVPGSDYDSDCIGCEETDDSGWNGVAYGIGTLGGEDHAVHAGMGVSFGSQTEFPVMVGAERRVSRRSKLITENWWIPGEGGAISFGVRRIGERWTFDYGLMALLGDGDVPYFPIVSFSYAFGGS